MRCCSSGCCSLQEAKGGRTVTRGHKKKRRLTTQLNARPVGLRRLIRTDVRLRALVRQQAAGTTAAWKADLLGQRSHHGIMSHK